MGEYIKLGKLFHINKKKFLFLQIFLIFILFDKNVFNSNGMKCNFNYLHILKAVLLRKS